MEFASLVTSLNPAIDMHNDSEELQFIQRELLRDLYIKGHLKKLVQYQVYEHR